MFLGRLSLLLPAYNHDDLLIIVAGLVREDDTGTKLVPDPTDVGALATNQETVVFGLAANLESVVLLGLGGRNVCCSYLVTFTGGYHTTFFFVILMPWFSSSESCAHLLFGRCAYNSTA